MADMHTLTIIIPSYNHEKYILACLSAVNSINIKSKRIIVIDDESTDGTVQVVKNFILNINNDVEIICKKNSGIVHSLNLGLKKADSEFFYMVASDDVPNAEGIETAVNYLSSNMYCHFYIGGGSNFFEDGSPDTAIYGPRHKIFFNLV